MRNMAGGRPAKFENEQELQDQINDYFNYIEGEFVMEVNEKTGKNERVYHRDPEPATITGLAIHLGFESRQSFYDYGKNSKFSYIIKKAQFFIEHEYEKKLSTNVNVTGPIFVLKNMGWSDKQELDHSSTDGTMSPKQDLSILSIEELKELKNIRNKLNGS